jgi:SPP1 family predicted phage head-tail adaptor
MASKCCDPKNSPAALRHRIKFQSLTLAIDDTGGQVETWADFAEVWASIEPKLDRERYFAQRNEPLYSHKIRLRYLAGLKASMRILFDGRIFEVKGVINEEEIKDWIEIRAMERTGT